MKWIRSLQRREGTDDWNWRWAILYIRQRRCVRLHLNQGCELRRRRAAAAESRDGPRTGGLRPISCEKPKRSACARIVEKGDRFYFSRLFPSCAGAGAGRPHSVRWGRCASVRRARRRETGVVADGAAPAAAVGGWWCSLILFPFTFASAVAIGPELRIWFTSLFSSLFFSFLLFYLLPTWEGEEEDEGAGGRTRRRTAFTFDRCCISATPGSNSLAAPPSSSSSSSPGRLLHGHSCMVVLLFACVGYLSQTTGTAKSGDGGF